jgi:preprotein translocase subunit SecG
MWTNLYISNDALQLILVHDTDTVSSFQAGGSKSIAIQNGWRDVQRKWLFFLGWIFLTLFLCLHLLVPSAHLVCLGIVVNRLLWCCRIYCNS